MPRAFRTRVTFRLLPRFDSLLLVIAQNLSTACRFGVKPYGPQASFRSSRWNDTGTMPNPLRQASSSRAMAGRAPPASKALRLRELSFVPRKVLQDREQGAPGCRRVRGTDAADGHAIDFL